MYLLIYLIIFTFIVFIFIIAAIKLNNPYWSLMPVYHKYDFWRYFYKNNFIFGELKNNKFYDYLQITTTETNNLSESNKKQMISFLQDHFLGKDYLLFTLNDKKFDATFNGCFYNSMCSFFRKQKYTVKDCEIVLSDEYNINGVIFSKKVNFLINNKKYDSYFIDYICNHREDSELLMKRKLLFTHIYNCLREKSIQNFLIKKNINLFKNVIPVISSKVYTYKISYYHKPELNLFEIKKIESNIDPIINLISTLKYNKNYDSIIYPDLGNLKLMINEKILEIYTLNYKNHILAYYIFKNTNILNELNNSEYLTCISSINNCPNDYYFFNGFSYILSDILRKNPEKNTLQIENFSQNFTIINKMNELYKIDSVYDTAFYSINLFIANTPKKCNNCFTLI